jgi:hypothetical protein
MTQRPQSPRSPQLRSSRPPIREGQGGFKRRIRFQQNGTCGPQPELLVATPACRLHDNLRFFSSEKRPDQILMAGIQSLGPLTGPQCGKRDSSRRVMPSWFAFVLVALSAPRTMSCAPKPALSSPIIA